MLSLLALRSIPPAGIVTGTFTIFPGAKDLRLLITASVCAAFTSASGSSMPSSTSENSCAEIDARRPRGYLMDGVLCNAATDPRPGRPPPGWALARRCAMACSPPPPPSG